MCDTKLKKSQIVLDEIIGSLVWKIEGADAGIDVIEKRTAKERVHMYAGGVGT